MTARHLVVAIAVPVIALTAAASAAVAAKQHHHEEPSHSRQPDASLDRQAALRDGSRGHHALPPHQPSHGLRPDEIVSAMANVDFASGGRRPPST
jgi:hypothetical protein